jgi:hypothetical protein
LGLVCPDNLVNRLFLSDHEAAEFAFQLLRWPSRLRGIKYVSFAILLLLRVPVRPKRLSELQAS